MFTGIIEEVGNVKSLKKSSGIMDITVETKIIFDDIKIGDSVSINGVCQTVTIIKGNSFTVQAVEETMLRTTFGKLHKGDPVNLERALRPSDRLGGHIVQGHVDCVGRVVSVKNQSGNILLSISPDHGQEKYIVEKGSIAVDGISLTVTYSKPGEFGISVIPHTVENTTLHHIKSGGFVNLETDIIAKHLEKLMLSGKDKLSFSKLAELGY
jgi:riboflavin synthase